MKLLGISGSLRAGSYNRKVLQTASKVLPDGVELEMFDGLKLVPPYDEDDDTDPAPPAVARLRTAIAGADALLIATPEYNASIPGQLKNALDWVSRPDATNVLRNKPVAVVGASVSAFGGVWSQAELRKVLSAIGARVLQRELSVAHAHERLDAEGRLEDEELRRGLRGILEELMAEVAPQATDAARRAAAA